MPGAVGRTSTHGLTNVTLPYARILAKSGWNRAIRENRGIATGANVINGKITYKGVAEAFNLEYVPVEKAI
jgi:alanine dehydrogenase